MDRHLLPSASRRRRRAGLATMEIVLSLFVLMLMLLGIFSVAMIGYCHAGTAAQARLHAWAGRHHPWRSSPVYVYEEMGSIPDDYVTILGDEPRVSPNIVLRGFGERRIPIPTPELARVFSVAAAEHIVMGGTWDHHEVTFEEQHEHRPLEPTDKFYLFASQSRRFSRFGELAQAAGAALTSAVEDARADYDRTGHQDESDLAAELQAELAEKQAELAALEADEDASEDEIRRVRHEIQHLLEALSHLGSAGGVHPPPSEP